MDFELITEFGLDDLNVEDELFANFVRRIAELLDTSPESLFSMMYRLDVREERIKQILHPDYPMPAARALAELILRRHAERMKTRSKYRQVPIAGWDKFDS